MTIKRKHGGNILGAAGGLAGDDPCCCEGSCLDFPSCLTGRSGVLTITGLIDSGILSVNCCIPYSHLGVPNTTTPANITEQYLNSNINGAYSMTNLGGGFFAWFETITSAPYSIEVARTFEDYLACGSLFNGAATILTKCWLTQIMCRVVCSDNTFVLSELSFFGTKCRSADNGVSWTGVTTTTTCGTYNYGPVGYCVFSPTSTSTPGACLFPCTVGHTHEVIQTYPVLTAPGGKCDYLGANCSVPSSLTASLTIT